MTYVLYFVCYYFVHLTLNVIFFHERLLCTFLRKTQKIPFWFLIDSLFLVRMKPPTVLYKYWDLLPSFVSISTGSVLCAECQILLVDRIGPMCDSRRMCRNSND